VEVDSIPQLAPENSQQVDNADLVVAIFAELDSQNIVELWKALRALPQSLRIVVIFRNSVATPPQTDSGNPESAPRLTVAPWPQAAPEPSGSPLQSISSTYQSIFGASEKMGARACCIIASKLETGTSQWVSQLAQPLLEADFDLAAPHYARHKLEGLLNSGIIYPLTRSLYGKQIQNPLGPDLGVSQRLFQKILVRVRNANASGRRVHPLASLASAALCENLRVCQVHLGARAYPPTDWQNISSLLVEILGPVFLDMERNAPCWQRIRGSTAAPSFGEPSPAEGRGTVDVGRLINSFQLGARDLQEIWGLVLPPASLLELRRLSRLEPEQFRMPDELWVRIVYDFALAHRLRTINRDHLLRSMTPLYLGWVASHAHEVETAEAPAVDERLERLSIAYEVGKSYLVSRWRWPDRFNP
jgi:hypothetical protein